MPKFKFHFKRILVIRGKTFVEYLWSWVTVYTSPGSTLLARYCVLLLAVSSVRLPLPALSATPLPSVVGCLPSEGVVLCRHNSCLPDTRNAELLTVWMQICICFLMEIVELRLPFPYFEPATSETGNLLQLADEVADEVRSYCLVTDIRPRWKII